MEQLGAQMYPSATATVAELISNAWDADARNVWVDMPYGDWEDEEIIVIDDGVGMDHQAAQEAYLVVGRNRREGGKQRTSGGRLVHGRKGIGKLAAFGTATILEVKTKQKGKAEVAFRLDYDKIRQQDPDEPYAVEPSQDGEPLTNPETAKALEHGTRVRLSGLRLKRRLNADQFRTSMSRRFALDEHEMKVFINGEQLRRYETDLEFRFPDDAVPPGVTRKGGWAVESLPDGREVRWWIGFTPKPIKDDDQQGISVIVRGKLAQRPFKFDAGGGTTGQLGQEYLVGEVIADWIDDEHVDSAADRDYIQSNRDQLQLEDEDLEGFLLWGRRRLRWALDQRSELKKAKQENRLEQDPAIDRLLRGRPKREQKALRRVAAAVADLPGTGDRDIVKVMEAVVGARDDESARSLAQDLALAGGDTDEFWALVRELAELDGRRSLGFIDARMGALDQLSSFEPGAALPRAVELLAMSPGLLDPKWEFADVAHTAETPSGHVVILDGPVGNALGVVLLVLDDGIEPDDVRRVIREAEAAHPDHEVVAVSEEGVGGGTVVSWRDILARARDKHLSWRRLVETRISRASEDAS